LLGAAAAAISILLFAADVLASGFYLPGRGVRANGRAGAFVASGEGNLNSLWYNPANLSTIEKLSLTADLAAVDLTFSFQRAPRTTENNQTVTYDKVGNQAPPEFSPQILVGGPTGADGLVWAAGFYAPYLSGSTWPEDGAQRYTLIDNEGSVLAWLGAGLAYNVEDKFRIGIGVQNMIGLFRLINMTSGYSGLYGRPEDEDLDILTKIEMESLFNPTGNIGVWASLTDEIEIAASFQLGATINDPNAKITVRMPSHPQFDGARLSNNTIDAAMELPPIARLGLRYNKEPFDLELTGVYEAWSVFDELDATPNSIDVENVSGVGAIPIAPLSIPQNYQDSFSVRLGGDYKWDEELTWRAGYAYETSAIKDAFYSVFLPDSDKHMISGGLTWNFGDVSIDGSAAAYFLENRTITNSEVKQINPIDAEDELATNVGDGDYNAFYFVMGVGVNYEF
jgi:long-chain fatty acid transport protein